MDENQCQTQELSIIDIINLSEKDKKSMFNQIFEVIDDNVTKRYCQIKHTYFKMNNKPRNLIQVIDISDTILYQ